MVQQISRQFRILGIRPYRICGGKGGTGTGSSSSTEISFSLAISVLISLLRILGDRKKSAGTRQQCTLQRPMLLKLKKKEGKGLFILFYIVVILVK
jgi:hypothetical protein